MTITKEGKKLVLYLKGKAIYYGAVGDNNGILKKRGKGGP